MTEQRYNDLFDGYGIAKFRTFRFDVVNLRFARSWGNSEYSGAPPHCAIGVVKGDAIAIMDDVRIIGCDLRSSEFSFSLRSDIASANDWNTLMSNMRLINSLGGDKDASAKGALLIKRVEERCKEKPPTAILDYMEKDIELGIKSHWWIEVQIPDLVLTQLEQDISSKAVEKLHLGVDWIFGLVNHEHAPPAYPVTWGIVKDMGGYSGMIGHVTSISWSLSTTSKGALNQPSTQVAESKGHSDDAGHLVQSIGLLAQAVKVNSNRITSALLIVIALVGVGYILN